MPSRAERPNVVILQLDLQNLIEVQDGFVCVADLDITCAACLSVRELFSFCAASS